MSKKPTLTKSGARKLIKSDLTRIDAMADDDIDYSDIPATTEEFWENARVLTGASRSRVHVANAADAQAHAPLGQAVDEGASLPTDVPRTESERRVWAIFENARASTISLVNSEKEGELVSEDLLNARIRTCR